MEPMEAMHKPESLPSLLEQFLNAETPQKAQELIEQYPELLSEEADHWLEQAIEAQDNDKDREWLQMCWELLERCRTVGINAAFAEASLGLKDAAQFLRQTLQLVAQSKDNLQQVYPVWEQQQACFREEMLVVLPTVAAQLLTGDEKQQTFAAAVLGLFAELIQQFPLGSRRLNLELAINCTSKS
ncbi:MAG TPA: hypothetical protein V6C65_33995 [Allocoleopsis sp.]